jgi:hypothetical protein
MRISLGITYRALSRVSIMNDQSRATAIRAVGVTFDRDPAALDSAITEVLNIGRTLVDVIKKSIGTMIMGGVPLLREEIFFRQLVEGNKGARVDQYEYWMDRGGA